MAYQSWSVVFGEQPSAAKWNILGTNDASFNDGTGIAASAITPEKLFTGTGTTHVWQTWTPTLANLSGGTQTYAKYIQIGKTVHFRFHYTLAGAGVAGSVTFTLPVTAAIGTANKPLPGNVFYLDAGVAGYTGFMLFSNTTTVILQVHLVSGTYGAGASLSSTVPHTWGASDAIFLAGTYEAA